jgi:type I restriction enzyme S subunit
MCNGWNISALGNIASVALSGVDKQIVSGEASVRLCNYLDVYRNRRLHRALSFSHGTATPGEIARFQLQIGDVLITKDSETPDDIGIPAVVVDDLEDVVCGYHLALIRPTIGLNSSFLGYYLQSETAKRYFLRTATGLTRFGLSVRSIASLPIPTPPPEEQAAIARILDSVDRAIELTREVIERSRVLNQSLINHLLEHGLDGQRLKSKRPAHWQIKRVDEVAEVGSGVTLGKDVSGSKYVELPYLRVANVQDGHLDLSVIKTVNVRVDEVDRYRLEPGDVLMTEGGDIDKLGRGTLWEGQLPDCLHQNHIFRVRANRDVLDPRYFALIVESDIAKGYFLRVAKRTTNLASTNKTQVRAFRFPVPPLSEQSQIADIVAAAKSKDRLLNQKEEALLKLKRALMHDLLTGKVRVNNLNAVLDGEPADSVARAAD